MFRMNGMPRAQEAQERPLSSWHSVIEIVSPVRLCVTHPCVLPQSTVHPEHNSESGRKVPRDLGAHAGSETQCKVDAIVSQLLLTPFIFLSMSRE